MKQRLHIGLIALGPALLALVLYARTAGFDFVNFDDNNYFYDNPHVTSGLTMENIRWAFEIHGPSMWVPLTWLSHQTAVQLFGIEPGPHHLINALLHAANAALLFLLVRRWSGKTSAALIAAALFAVHPIHSESVAWITERKDVLAGFFCFLTLLAYDRYARRPHLFSYIAVLCGTLLANMAKPLAVTLPCLMLLLDFWPYDRRRPFRILLEKVPLFAIVAFSAWMTTRCQLSIHAIGSSTDFPLGGRLANSAVAYATYLSKLAYPADLAVFYPYPDHHSHPVLIASILLLVLITVWALRRLRTAPWNLVGWCWFLGALVPMIGIVQAGSQAMADRYLYLPAVGFYLIVAMLWAQSRFCRGASVIIVLLLMVGNISQTAVWKNSRSLFAHALAVTENNYLAHNNYGLTFRTEGDLETARREFEASIAANPDYAEGHNNLGITLAELGDFTGAMQHLGRLSDATALYNLGTALLQNDQASMAEHWLLNALDIDPDNPDILYNIGCALQAQLRYTEAIAAFDSVLSQITNHVGAGVNRNYCRHQLDEAWRMHEEGNRLREAGRLIEAEAAYRQALSINPRLAEAYNNLGVVLGMTGRHGEALDCFNNALHIAPDYPDARTNAAQARQVLITPGS
ncbi:MAG: tetratricopeptide repeat protein [Pontiellaceae bacterium]|nr:tetratricopeptide repeat protein [Pontiellaceae bacterium]MBN2785644.1 tetratricopeptide repeat protein [Pontiellaceae bacterium]